MLHFTPGQIPDAHLRGYALWPEQGPPQLVQPDGPGVQDTDFLLYVWVAHTSKCHREVRPKSNPLPCPASLQFKYHGKEEGAQRQFLSNYAYSRSLGHVEEVWVLGGS